MLDSMAFVIFLVIVALVFDFLNGFHDSANSISTVVSTRVLSPKYAVIWAAFFNFAAVFFVGTAVAHTVGKGIIHLDIVDNLVILSALRRCYHLEYCDLVLWTTQQFFSCLNRRSYRRGCIQSRNKHIGLVGHYQNNCFYHCFPCHWYGARFYFHGSYHESEP